MAVPTYAELKNLTLDRAGLNPQQTVLSCGTTLSSVNVTSAALFGAIVAGMQVSGTGIPAGTTVISGGGSASPSAIVISQQSTATTGTYALTFYGPDAPVSDTEFGRYINDALRDVWEMSGGRIKTVSSQTAWSSAELQTGTVTGLLSDVQEVVHLHQTTLALGSVTQDSDETPGSPTILPHTPATTFPTAVVTRMEVSGSHVPAGTTVLAVASDHTSVTLSANAATGATHEVVTFKAVDGTEMERKPLSYIHYLRSFPGGYPSYKDPKLYAATRIATPSGGTPNLLQLDYWPELTGFLFPLTYVPQFVEIDPVTNTYPDLNDTEAHDGALIAAFRLAIVYGRPELVAGIVTDMSARAQEIVARKAKALLSADAE